MPDKKLNIDVDDEKILYTDIIWDNVPKQFEIDRRNGWMINQADYVAYVRKNWGGAHKFKTIAEKKGKTVINLYNGE